MAAQDLASTIGTTAQGPAAASSDAGSVTQQPVAAQIAADQYLAAKAARSRPGGGVIFSKLLPAGAVSDQQGTRQGGTRFDGGC